MKKLLRFVIVAVILVSGAVVGWVSVYSSINKIGSVAVEGAKGWRQWDLAAGSSANPYALAHFLLAGQVPPANGLFHVYSRSTDDQGNPLIANCHYQVSAIGFESRWWSLSLNPPTQAQNSSAVLTSETISRFDNGEMIINVAASPRSGNWLRVSHYGSFVLRLVVSNDNSLEEGEAVTLPSVIKIGCV